ncbi:acetyl esterase/lipase [Saccharopolyspora lacisalsi]|uniref:Acetyl esterase/lipase n=1 Tax=Halosaccharopolyspora lacisalsi TaxID=1000566 RepID=A0A839E511_9PSEU|nr:alpha/beta hydrolase [Halosaccharopolyspora lacisalsi]MBA8826421.1 acetyl esterase/lipase [Halosaccharopolyspora lacisalsi]
MTSVRSRLLIGWFRATGRKQVFLDTSRFDRSIVDSQRKRTSKPPAKLYRRHHVRRTDVRGFPCVTLAPRERASGQHVLYLHGGAYVHSIERSHWRFVSRLVDLLACTVTVPVYPLAPDYHYDEAQAVIAEAYERHLADVDPAQQVVMGDSAGGGLTLVLARMLREQGRPQPAHLVLLSPWLDATMRDPAVPTLDRRDPYLSTPGLLEAARMYSGDLDPADPLISPLNGTFDGLGRISVFIGTRDVLLLDSRRLRSAAAREGVDIDYVEYRDMVHGWPLLQYIPEARRATAELVDLLRAHR